MRLLAHAGLTLSSPDAALLTNVGACAFRGHQLFFIGEAVPAQQTRQGGRGRDHPMLLQQPCGKIRHGDVGLSLRDPTHQIVAMRV